jgi:hypothetical protein
MSEGRQGQVQRCLWDRELITRRNLKSLKGWRRNRSRGYRARQTDDCSAENRRCPSAEDVQHNRNKTQQCRNPAGTSSCSSPKIGSRQRIHVVMNHGQPMTSHLSRGPPVSDVCSVRGTSTCFKLLDLIPCVPLPTSRRLRIW